VMYCDGGGADILLYSGYSVTCALGVGLLVGRISVLCLTMHKNTATSPPSVQLPRLRHKQRRQYPERFSSKQAGLLL
jgi:hypothetical protein